MGKKHPKKYGRGSRQGRGGEKPPFLFVKKPTKAVNQGVCAKDDSDCQPNSLKVEGWQFFGFSICKDFAKTTIEFGGYKFSDAVKIKKGGDGLFRSNLYEKATVFFTRNEVHMYKAVYNSISKAINEITEVLFYSDIVSVSTDNESKSLGNESVDYLTFVLTSTGGKQFSVALLGNDNRQRSINAMRALIKEKKLG